MFLLQLTWQEVNIGRRKTLFWYLIVLFKMKVSIITICYNNEREIRDTIESVINQSYGDIEYIIKDGGSTDGTMGIVNEYKDKIAKIISCPDRGIYDALN